MRLTKIITRGGDDGSTGIADGSRLSKASARINAIGEVDELGVAIGLALAESLPGEVRDCLHQIQNDLFELGGELAQPGKSRITESMVAGIEAAAARLNGKLTPLQEFILPQGVRGACLCHLARTVCRRAERSLVTLSVLEPVDSPALRYLNRLSDLLFILARVVNREAGRDEVYWTPRA